MKLSDNVPAEFKIFLDMIYDKNPMQRKRIESFLNSQNRDYWNRVKLFSEKMTKFIEAQRLNIDYVINAYLRMCQDILTEHIKFKRSGKYSCKSASEAIVNVYTSEKKMASYMYGLALSQFLWPNHYAMYDFFISESKKLVGVNNFLEIGPGHGLFLVESIKNFPDAIFDVIDISPVSKNISESMVTHFIGTKKCSFHVKDVNQLKTGGYDYIVMCEVLEHLDNPQSVLSKIYSLLNEGGAFFITTCANCPAIDHVYQYHCVEHIQKDISKAGFDIISELSLPVEDFPENQWVEKKIEVNYAAMLEKV